MGVGGDLGPHLPLAARCSSGGSTPSLPRGRPGRHVRRIPCGWLFLDRSRSHTRRWCDMQDAAIGPKPAGTTTAGNAVAVTVEVAAYTESRRVYEVRICRAEALLA